MTDQSYFKFTFQSDETELLVSFLNQHPFNGFEMVGNKTVLAYLAAEHKDKALLTAVESYKVKLNFDYTLEEIASQNWNATWEEDFEPVMVDDFCAVRADFHADIPNVKYQIIITPQTSFGTGHHETTQGMIEMMRDIVFKGKKVLDFGCGTGILSILSAKMGANSVLGVDIDNNAYMNSLHNCAQNKTENVQILKGDLSATEDFYDIILANINRHVILETLPSLSRKLDEKSPLLISGILQSDIALIERNLKEASFKIVNSLQNKDWMCILTEKV